MPGPTIINIVLCVLSVIAATLAWAVLFAMKGVLNAFNAKMKDRLQETKDLIKRITGKE